jgi:Flp pilus assembly pilin Flp
MWMFLRRRRGTTLSGYGLVVGLIAVAALFAVSQLGDAVQGMFDTAGDNLEIAGTGLGSSSGSGGEDGEGEEEGEGSSLSDPPSVASGQSFTVSEDAVEGESLGMVSATDDVAVTGFSITAGDSGGFFSISASGGITVTAAGEAGLNYETAGSYSLTVEAEDGDGQTGSATVDVAVTDVGDSKVFGSDTNNGDNFGVDVAMNAAEALVGANLADFGGSDSGKVYRIDLATRTVTGSFGSPSPNSGDRFGVQVAMQGNLAGIGADTDELSSGGVTDSGLAYLYDLGSDTFLHTLSAGGDAQANANFGNSIAIEGDYVLVGAPKYNDPGISGTTDGRVYLFSATTGTLTDTMVTTFTGRFGNVLDIDGDVAVIGAYLSGPGQSGQALLYDLSDLSGTTPVILAPAGLASSDYFGSSVAILGTRAVIGARQGTTGSFSNGGSVYVYDISNFGTASPIPAPTQLAATGLSNGAFFGWAVAVTADRIVATARDADGISTSTGAAWVYDAGTLTQTGTLSASDGALSDFFGLSAAMRGDTVLIGAGAATGASADSGAAYFFDLP